MVSNTIIIFMIGFISSYLLVPFSIKIAKKLNAMDIPNERKIHKVPTPRLGGLAVIIGFTFAVIFAILNIVSEYNFTNDAKIRVLGYFLGALIIVVIGFIDDCKDVKALIKFLGQIIATIVVMSFGIKINDIGIPFLGQNIELPTYISYLITFFWILGVTNAINIIDGLDGLSSGISLIASLTLIFVFTLNNSPVESILLISALAGATLGFLPFNSEPAQTYIGDMGSTFLGFSLSVLSIIGLRKNLYSNSIICTYLSTCNPNI